MPNEYLSIRRLEAMLHVVIKQTGLDEEKIRQQTEDTLRLNDLLDQKKIAIQNALEQMGLDKDSVNILSCDFLTGARRDLIQKNHWGEFMRVVVTELGCYLIVDRQFLNSQNERASDLSFILNGKYY